MASRSSSPASAIGRGGWWTETASLRISRCRAGVTLKLAVAPKQMSNFNSQQAWWLTTVTDAVFPPMEERPFISNTPLTAKTDTTLLDRAIANLRGAQAAAFTGINQLSEALAEEFSDDDKQHGALRNAVGRLRGLALRVNDGGLAASLSGAVGSPAVAQIDSALGLVGKWVDFASTDELMREIDGNVQLPVVRPFMDCLYEIKEILKDSTKSVLS